MTIYTIDAYPELCQVRTYRQSQANWVAIGTFMGRPLQQSGRTENTALNRWRDMAEFRHRIS